jgi:hypothetical protein
MPISAQNTFAANRLDPLYDFEDALTLPSNFVPNSTILKGTILGAVTAAVNEVQTLTITATGGTYTISYTDPISGVVKTTAALNYNDNAATIQGALNAAGVLGTSGVAVTSTGPWTITFSGTAYAGKAQNLLVPNVGSLTGGSATITRATAGAAAGVLKAYASGNSDGSQIPKGIAQYDMFIDISGNVYLGATSAISQWGEVRKDAPYYFAGTFDTSLLVGLDANAVTAGGWRLVSGTVTAGVLRMG